MLNRSSHMLVMFAAVIGSFTLGSPARAEELPAQARVACQYLETKAVGIFKYCYPAGTGDTPDKPPMKFDGHRKLEDGFELTYTFRWGDKLSPKKEGYVTLAFLFDTDGKMDSILFKDTYLHRGSEKDPLQSRYLRDGHLMPFLNDVSNTADLSVLRDKLKEHPKVKDNRKHLRTAETATARELCELWLRLEQPKK